MSSSLATTSSPLVPASSRWTIPGRSGPPRGASGIPIPSRRLTTVPPRRFSVGWVGSPAGLRTTTRCSSRQASSSGGPSAGSSAAGARSTWIRSPPARRCDFSRAAPSTSTPPAAIARCTSARVHAEMGRHHGVQAAGLGVERLGHGSEPDPVAAGSEAPDGSA